MMARKAECVYCGNFDETTQEHVIFICLFRATEDAPRPTDPVTVPVCRRCNGEKSQDDDFLRDFLVFDDDSAGNQVAQALLEGKISRSHQRNRSQIGRAVADARTKAASSDANSHSQRQCFNIGSERVVRIFSMIVRGLYYHVAKQRLPNDCLFEVAEVRLEGTPELWAILSGHGRPEYLTIGDDVFDCWYWVWPDDLAVSQWVLRFYGGLHFTVLAHLPGTFDHLRST